jgi:hypothetical protein
LKILRRAPEIVVTDLDGRFEDILSAVKLALRWLFTLTATTSPP